jgi:hypothetical protein
MLILVRVGSWVSTETQVTSEEQHEVGTPLGHHRERLDAVRRLAHHLHVEVGEHQRQAAAGGGLVVDDEGAHHVLLLRGYQPLERTL